MSNTDNVSGNPSEEDVPSQEVELVDRQDISEWIKPDAPEEVLKAIHDALSLRRVSMSYKAPLPLSGEFRRYEEVLPGAADRILGLAEKSLELTRENYNVTRRQISANAWTAFGMMALTAFLAWLGLGNFVIVPLGLSGIATLFLREIIGFISSR